MTSSQCQHASVYVEKLNLLHRDQRLPGPRAALTVSDSAALGELGRLAMESRATRAVSARTEPFGTVDNDILFILTLRTCPPASGSTPSCQDLSRPRTLHVYEDGATT